MTDAKAVKFIFVCPNKNMVFESSVFKILDNRGMITDEAGNKSLDAKEAAKTHRWAGHCANPHPATQVFELIDKIPQALSRLLGEERKEETQGRYQKISECTK